jgi:hypothetical protein
MMAYRYVPGSAQSNRSAADGDLYQYAALIAVNLDPRRRIAAYIDSNYDHVQVWVVAWLAVLVPS